MLSHMFRILSITPICLVLAFSNAYAQGGLELSTNRLDFGTVSLGQSHDRTLQLSNAGNADLRLTARITNDLSFTLLGETPSGQVITMFFTNQTPIALAQGRTTRLTLRFAPQSSGSQTSLLEIISDAPVQPRLSVSLKGVGTPAAAGWRSPEIAVSPRALDFGEVTVGREVSQSLLLANDGDEPLLLRGITVGQADFAASPAMAGASLAPGGVATVTVRFRPTTPGLYDTQLAIASNDPDHPEIGVRLAGKGIQPALEVTPTTLDFGKVAFQGKASRTLTLSNKGNSPLEVYPLACDTADFAVTSPEGAFTLASGGQKQVTLTFAPGSPGNSTGTLTVRSADPANPSVTVSLKGIGYYPELGYSPSSLNFGSVAVGASKDLPVAFRNLGTEPLVIKSYFSETAPFGVSSPALPITIAAAAQRTILVRYTPCSSGPQNGKVFFESNDPETPTVAVVVSGNATAASEPTVIIKSSAKGWSSVQAPFGDWQTNYLNFDVSFTLKPKSLIKNNNIWESRAAEGVGSIHYWGQAVEPGLTYKYDWTHQYDLAHQTVLLQFSPTDAALLYARIDLLSEGNRPDFYGLKYFEDRNVVRVYVQMPNDWWFDDAYDLPGTNCVSGFQCDFGAQVVEAGTDRALSDARVELGPLDRFSDASGHVQFPRVSAGNYEVRVTLDGYNPLDTSVALPPFGVVSRVYALTRLGEINVTSLTSKYSGFRYYLDTVPFPVTFQAQVDWGGHPPGKVLFQTPRQTAEERARADTASHTFDLGADFGPNGTLSAVAVSQDGVRSTPKDAELVVMPAIPWTPWIRADLVKGDFNFKSSGSLFWKIGADVIPPGTIPESTPVFGGRPCAITVTLPEVEIELKDSHVNYAVRLDAGLETTGNLFSRLRLGQVEVELLEELLLTGDYSRGAGGWRWQGGLGIKGKEAVYPLVAFSPGYPIVYAYGKLGVALEGEVRLLLPSPNPSQNAEVLDAPFNWGTTTGTASVAGKGVLGATLTDLVKIEASARLGFEPTFELAPSLRWKEAHGFFEIEAQGNLFLLRYKQRVLRWDFPKSKATGPNATSIIPLSEPTVEPLARDYLQGPDYGLFVGSKRGLAQPRPLSSGAAAPSQAPLQMNVFPYSDAKLATAGTNLAMVWLYDDPQRAAENRTKAVFSRFDGHSWTEPVPIADDGTVDFHPQPLGFANGVTLAVWEDEQRLLDPPITLESLTSNLEIAAAWFDPGTAQWSPAQRLTANGYLDRSPIASGPSRDKVLLVWVANPDNDIFGGQLKPNSLYCSRWDGHRWGAAQRVAEIPYPLMKYDFLYDGTNAEIVLSLDTDQDPVTIEDRELFRISYQHGVWGQAERLTRDTVPDDNPKLAMASNGHIILVWMSGNGIASAVNFNLEKRQLLHADVYSSQVADFKLASGPDRQLALVWAEPSQFTSDLWAMFYDPSFDVWGKRLQLTSDEETEKWFSPAFFGTNTLVAVYNRALPPNATVQTNETTDLYLLQYPLAHDVLLKNGSLLPPPANPSPGESIELRATVANSGALPSSQLAVACYLGDPSLGGREISRTNLDRILVSGDSADVLFSWVVPATTQPLRVCVVVDPDQVIPETDRANNSAFVEFTQADLALPSITWSQVASNQVEIVAQVANLGAIPSDPTAILFRKNDATGPVFLTRSIPALAKGAVTEVKYLWDVTGLDQDLTLFIMLDNAGIANEFDPTNNQAQLVIQRAVRPLQWTLGSPLRLPNGVFQFTVKEKPAEPSLSRLPPI